ncbi:fimbria/pilus outer membrane usher protein [Klebsiella oxytoca]|uniref:fimbria/pilus outer membrane usher protein n=1 Tax=Klebsiella oxytoca TaxID=571 RepID=UPI002596111E|nr:fimbria/pilus outer membrane usher protein [Klebsiella oxytoca]MDM4093022.1 fimbria/pilus outer membrane usher protein [Klebsiella oxytoca]
MRYFILFILALNPAAYVHADEGVKDLSDKDNGYIFDPTLFKGGGFDQPALEKLIYPEAVAPGDYKLDVFVNQSFIGNYLVSFVAVNNKVLPCISIGLIRDIGFKEGSKINDCSEEKCYFISKVSPQANSKTDLSIFKISIVVPQALLKSRPRGYVNPENYDTGVNIGFANYITNYYHVSYSDNNISNQDSAWLSFNGGLNIATWQYRQLSTATWSEKNGYTWNNIRNYVQRPLPVIDSQFMAGQLVTNGRFFSGMNFTGLNLSTADAMLPDSMRGYAPVVRGIATSNAKVTISQNGQYIYQTTVPPGAFEINDLYPTNSSGDLQVQVMEADGTVKTFMVPFSAVPESMRPGISHYNLAIGRTRNTQKEASFADAIYQRGITNAITANSGIRVAQDYLAAVLGTVYTSSIGAVGMDATFSHAKLPANTYEGWMGHISWSKSFQPYGTTVSLAGYRYSTSGYRELTDILGMRYYDSDGTNWMSYTNSQRSRFDITLSQSMGNYGNLFITGATQDYRNGHSRDTQLQFGYSKAFAHGINMNLSVTRQRTGSYYDTGTMETATSVSFSIPLFASSPRGISLSTSYSHSNNSGDQYQATASGMIDKSQTTSYSLSALRDIEYNQTTLSGNLQQRLPKVNLGLNASTGKGYWQAAGNAQGALAIHSGGVTFGPYLGDTFALVEAKGAEGAKLFNSSQTTIDSSGYALLPSVTAYRYNNVSLDPQGMEGNAEVLDSQKRVAPVAGAGVKVKFRTRIGTALLIKTVTDDGNILPMGTEIYNAKGEAVGITGQGGQVYVRVEQTRGKLWVGKERENKRCAISYDLTNIESKAPLISLTGHCISSRGESAQ